MIRYAAKIEDLAVEASSGVIGPGADLLLDIGQLQGRPAHDRSQAIDRAFEYASQPCCDGTRVLEPA